jgi:glycosyltransferase involved in cell wall biosynthesis
MSIRSSGPITVSAVIPCFNGHLTLPRTLAGLRAQTVSLFEIVVVDDGSTDPETILFLDSLTGISLVRQQNMGLPGARNAGIRASKGTHVLPLDADDWLAPNAVEKLVESLQRCPQAAYASSHIMLEGEAGGELAKNYNFFEQLFLNQMPYCFLLPKEIWQASGGYNEKMRKGYEDWEFNIRLGRLGYHGVIVKEPLFHYFVSQKGMLQAISTKRHGELWKNIQDQHADLYTYPKLFETWKKWRRQPSTYPLTWYFGWFALYQLLPPSLFQFLFRRLKAHSHAKRVTHSIRSGH